MKQRSGLSICVDMNSDNLVRKLKAISKHTEALATELGEIDKTACPECNGSDLRGRTLHLNRKEICKSVYCNDCGYVKSEIHVKEL
jgi:Zn ribbon nucleic-acid-binding protein